MALLTAYVDVPEEREPEESDAADHGDDGTAKSSEVGEHPNSRSEHSHTSMSIVARRHELDEWLVARLTAVRDGSADAQANAQRIVEEFEDEVSSDATFACSPAVVAVVWRCCPS